MIIRSNGMVVGILDPQTMSPEDITDPTLQSLLDEWKKDGFDIMIPSEEEGDDGDNVDSMTNIPYGIKARIAIEDGLLAQGFEVQTE